MRGKILSTGTLVAVLVMVMMLTSISMSIDMTDGQSGDLPEMAGSQVTDSDNGAYSSGSRANDSDELRYYRYSLDGDTVTRTIETAYKSESVYLWSHNIENDYLGPGTYYVDYSMQHDTDLYIKGPATFIIDGDHACISIQNITIEGDVYFTETIDAGSETYFAIGSITPVDDDSSFTCFDTNGYVECIENLDFYSFDSNIYVSNEQINAPVSFDGPFVESSNVYVYGGSIDYNCLGGNVIFDENSTLIADGGAVVNADVDEGSTAFVNGDVDIRNGTLNLNISGGSVGIKDGDFDINGMLYIHLYDYEEDPTSTGIADGTIGVNGTLQIDTNTNCITGGDITVDGTLDVDSRQNGVAISGGTVKVEGTADIYTINDYSVGIAGGTVEIDGETTLRGYGNSKAISGGTVDLIGNVTTTGSIGTERLVQLDSGTVTYHGGGTADFGRVELDASGGKTSFNIHDGNVHIDRIESSAGDAMLNIDGGRITIDDLESNVNISDGYVYVPGKIESGNLTVSGGGALFYNDMDPSTHDNSDYDEEMYIYTLSEVYDHLELYAKAYRNGEGYQYVIDHIHDENGPWHEEGVYHHQHCGVPRYDEPYCDYSPDTSFHTILYRWVDEYTHEAYCSNPDCTYGFETEHSHDGTYRPVEDDEYGHYYGCPVCGGEGYEEHDLQGYLTDDLRHYIVCSECGWWRVSDHEIHFTYHDEENHDWHCDECGDGGTVEHEFTWVDNGDGTHTGTCYCRTEDGSLHQVIEEHHYVDGVCDKCGAIHPGLIGGGMDDYYPPVWGYDEIQDVGSKEKEEWIAIAVAATAATIMAVFLIWDRKRGS